MGADRIVRGGGWRHPPELIPRPAPAAHVSGSKVWTQARQATLPTPTMPLPSKFLLASYDLDYPPTCCSLRSSSVEAKVNSGSLSSGATGGRLPELSSWCKREDEGEREGGRGVREAVEAETRGREGT